MKLIYVAIMKIMYVDELKNPLLTVCNHIMTISDECNANND